ncbi:hypothetical protein LUX57_15345 [Actinomadura madurae]|uniref:hypothetical protein n=1 Tax=Actinomadura madurae TaxID=1993 RepID=UPI0020D1FF0E|nr:hypothetical protein [Actinomadura madurae]MCP9966311.1 hypothetical protein [Actinomadura madurae]
MIGRACRPSGRWSPRTRISIGTATAGATTTAIFHSGASAELIGSLPLSDPVSSRIAAPISSRLSHSRPVSRSPKKTSAMSSSGTTPDMKIGTAVDSGRFRSAMICSVSPPSTNPSAMRKIQLLTIDQIMCGMRLPRTGGIRSAASLKTANPR